MTEIAPITRFIRNGTYNGYRGEMFTVPVASSNEVSPYTPFYCALMERPRGVVVPRIYYYPEFYPYIPRIQTRYTQFFSAFNSGWSPILFQHLHVMKGTIYQIDSDLNAPSYVPMVVLAVDSAHVLSMNMDNPDYTKFSLFLNNKFVSDYKLIYKKMEKEMFPSLIQAGVDIVYTNDIMKWCYRKDHSAEPKFRTTSEMRNYLNSLNQYVLHAR